LKEPKPYIWITAFGNFAVEYTLFLFINKIRLLPKIDATIKKIVLEICKQEGIDISTPNLVQRVGNSTNGIDV